MESTRSPIDAARRIAHVLHDAGYQSHFVGGCVRDQLLGLHPKDYDVATDATPQQVLALFPNADKVGAHFGVVIEDGIEIATFRSDSTDSDGRRPSHVTYETTPYADAKRRDFTINALFMDPFTGHIVDFFGGLDDIKHKILRAVGDPHKRFHEDHLRMMRAVRFAATLGFTIDPATLAAMSAQAHNIKLTATERPTEELRKALTHDAAKSIRIMKSTGLLKHLLPEVDDESAVTFATTMRILSELDRPRFGTALAALFVMLSPNSHLAAARVEAIARRIKLSTDELDSTTAILKLQTGIGAVLASIPTLDVLKKLVRQPHFAEALALYDIRLWVGDLQSPSLRDSFSKFVALYSGMTHEDLHPTRFVTGDDLIALGMKPGKLFREILDRIEIGQLTGDITNHNQAMSLLESLAKL